ncbi:hypothetical protein GCM10010211_77900 [Streptomyces albospinus]|uniref:Uncharacterized protein n=1 Tax=Streptomyces albospinus TaxID=285515 RepID=A0ABQ2VMB4_9ACTN|nr:hypothetical protein GCM10010211_77900 [Streptomyces albospinus]
MNASRPSPTHPEALLVDCLATVRAQEYRNVFDELLGGAARLDMLRRLERGSVAPHATAAMHTVRFAAAILWPTVPNTRHPTSETTPSACSSSPPTGARRLWNPATSLPGRREATMSETKMMYAHLKRLDTPGAEFHAARRFCTRCRGCASTRNSRSSLPVVLAVLSWSAHVARIGLRGPGRD